MLSNDFLSCLLHKFKVHLKDLSCLIQFSFFLLLVSVDPNDHKKTACYDIDVEVEDPLKSQMSSFLLSTANQQEIASLDNKVRFLCLENASEIDFIFL